VPTVQPGEGHTVKMTRPSRIVSNLSLAQRRQVGTSGCGKVLIPFAAKADNVLHDFGGQPTSQHINSPIINVICCSASSTHEIHMITSRPERSKPNKWADETGETRHPCISARRSRDDKEEVPTKHGQNLAARRGLASSARTAHHLHDEPILRALQPQGHEATKRRYWPIMEQNLRSPRRACICQYYIAFHCV